MIHDPLRPQPAAEGQPSSGDGERIAKLLARAGVASRREVERLIEAGRVALNGQVLTTPAVRIDPGDIVTVDGEVVGEVEPTRVFRYHKPVGLLTSHNDPQGRPTVFEALPPGLPRLISIGRLDINSEGLLLLTNDGGLARALELPTTGIVRRYRARAHGRITQERLDRLKDGITVEGVRYGSIDAKLDKAKEGPQGANVWVTVTLSEGKNREVRRVLEAVGLKVNRLLRLSYGPFALATLPVGQIEEVGPRVVRELLAEHIDPENLPKGDRPQFRNPVAIKAAAAGELRRAQTGAQEVRQEEAPKKKEYKAGWAKAKIVAKPHAPKRKPKPSARDEALKAEPRPGARGAKPGAKAGAKPAIRSAAKPGAKPGARPSGKPGAASGLSRPAPRPPAGPRKGGPKRPTR